MNIDVIKRRVLASRKKGDLLLDEFPNAAAAYSLRLLNSQYTGDCIEVRRSSDNATQNIGFVDGVLDTTSLLSFVGSGDGLVSNWYDQSGNGRDAIFGVAGTQQRSRIVHNGLLETIDGFPSIHAFTAGIRMWGAVGLDNNQDLPVSVIFAGQILQLPINVSNNVAFVFGGNGPTGGGSRYDLDANPDVFRVRRRGSPNINVTTFTPFNTNPYIQQGFWGLSDLRGRQNGIDSITEPITGTPLIQGDTFTVMGANGNNSQFSPQMKGWEYIIYLSDEHANRIGIEQNINAYYNIY